MISAVQHVPAFVSGHEPNRATVATTAELLALPWLAQYTKPRAGVFHRWSRSDNYLMVEYENGARWWVVARLEGETPELAKWGGPPK